MSTQLSRVTWGAFTWSFFVVLLAFSLPSQPAAAQGTERIKDFGDWSAFRYRENSQTICYMATIPKKDEGDYTVRGKIFGIVTHRPAQKIRNEVSFVIGYTFKKDSTAELTIGDRKWKLFTDADGAFAADAETDNAIVQAMVKGTSMTLRGTSSRGTETKDTYSLIGFTKAHKAIDTACK